MTISWIYNRNYILLARRLKAGHSNDALLHNIVIIRRFLPSYTLS